MAEDQKTDITTLTVQLVSAFVAHNSIPSEGLVDLIKSTRAALIEDLAARTPASVPDHVPAVSVRKSLSSPQHILSLIDGKPYKTLKRHLACHGLTDREYRERYNLPASYPMVAPSYSEARRAVAQKSGLGRKPTGSVRPEPAALAATPNEKADFKTSALKVPARKTQAKAALRATKAEAAVPPPADAALARAPSLRKAKETATPDEKTAPAILNGTPVGKPATATKADRKKLSIATFKDDKAESRKASKREVTDKPAEKRFSRSGQ